jgi:hypothetical protein
MVMLPGSLFESEAIASPLFANGSILVALDEHSCVALISMCAAGNCGT